ncbi:MAG: hypothetical protein ACPL07_01965 [Candidatus Bathyarchaeia archaeon]
MPKPKGSTGATKMKILAIICHNGECGRESYGYGIWQDLKRNFHIYLNHNEVRNVYHHLRDLCETDLLLRIEGSNDVLNRCKYKLTEKGEHLKEKYRQYLEILEQNKLN